MVFSFLERLAGWLSGFGIVDAEPEAGDLDSSPCLLGQEPSWVALGNLRTVPACPQQKGFGNLRILHLEGP